MISLLVIGYCFSFPHTLSFLYISNYPSTAQFSEVQFIGFPRIYYVFSLGGSYISVFILKQTNSGFKSIEFQAGMILTNLICKEKE